MKRLSLYLFTALLVAAPAVADKKLNDLLGGLGAPTKPSATATPANPTPGTAHLPEAVRVIAGGVDQSDPLLVAVFSILKGYEDGFAAIIDGPLSAEARELVIQDFLDHREMDQAHSTMDRLRLAEIHADEARAINVSLPGGTGHFFQQEIVDPISRIDTQGVNWLFEVPREERAAFARDLHERLGQMFRRDPGWMEARADNTPVLPDIGSFTHSRMVAMSGKGTRLRMESLMVVVGYSVQPWVTDRKGVSLQVLRTVSGPAEE